MGETDAKWGGGPYEPEAKAALAACRGTGLVMLVRSGKHGDGFEALLDGPELAALPRVLREIADHVERVTRS